MPLVSRPVERRRDLDGARSDHRCGLVWLRGNDSRDARLQDPGLFPSDRADSVAKECLMIEGNRRDRSDGGTAQDVGRIEPAAEADFEQRNVGRDAGEGEECRCGRDLEKCDRRIPVGALAFLRSAIS